MEYKTLVAIAIIGSTTKVANAIVIVPPIIYIATFSLGSFILNVFTLTAFYMAAKGLLDRFYFGKQMHELVGIALAYLGCLVIIMATAIISIAIFDPIDARSLFYASIFSTFLSFLLIALSNFRKYTLADQYLKNKMIMSMFMFSAIVFVITFVSAYYSISTSILKKDAVMNRSVANGSAQSTPQDSFGVRNKSADFYEKESAAIPSVEADRVVWFYPFKDGICEIYAGGIFVKAEKSKGKCFYYGENNDTKRIECPIGLDVAEVKNLQLSKSLPVQIEGRGSCLDAYRVYISEKGFKTIK